ncbi:MAG TPA: phenylalanine--tRNA ligase subunit beta, partial [Anaerolineae bacterium]
IKNDSMVCSEKELGLSDEHDGIIILPPDAPAGMPLADYLGDVVLDIAILPSTIRAASIIGVAREVAAITGQKLRYPRLDYVESGSRVDDLVQIEIRDPRLNPRFTIGIAQGVRQGQSPYWMQRRLTLAGMRPINNIVDISNYVMLETGHPTHAFDYDAISVPAKIITRLAQPGEELTTLDGAQRKLQANDIVVADTRHALSIAGVMGGAESEVKDHTRNILFEVATWNWVNIRRTARFHNLNSEASYRFAHNLHPDLAMLAQKRGLSLLQQLAGASIARGILDAYPLPFPSVAITLDPDEVARLLGVVVSVAEITRILTSLEFDVAPEGGKLRVTAPMHRTDIEGAHDLIEEIARIYGYDRIPSTLMRDEIPSTETNLVVEFDETLRDVLVEAGLQEIVSYRLTTPEAERRILPPDLSADDRQYVALQNPINPERLVMRHTLIAGALESLALNIRHHERVALFELGSVYLPGEDGPLPDEVEKVVIVMAGGRDRRSWRQSDMQTLDFFDLKGVVESMLQSLHIHGATYSQAEQPIFYPGRVATVCLEQRGHDALILGVLGELHPQVREAWELPATTPVLLAEFDVAMLRLAGSGQQMAHDVLRFPAVNEDLAVVVNEEITADQVLQVIQRAGGNLLRDARLFDIYRGEQIGAGKKSMAYALTYQAVDRTLTDSDVERQRNKIIRSLENQISGVIRR